MGLPDGAGRNGSARASGETKPRKPGKKVRTEIPPSWECARVPGKEAQMKGGAAGGKQAVRTEGQLFAARPGAAAARTAALCANVIKGPVGANVWSPLTPRHSHTTAEPEQGWGSCRGRGGGSAGFRGSPAKRGQRGVGGPRQQEAKPSLGPEPHFLLLLSPVPRSSRKPCHCPDPS